MEITIIPDSIMHDHLRAKKDLYISFSNITEEIIRDIWYKEGDLYIKDLSTLVYRHDLPLWCKMIFRYRNSNRNPVLMQQGITHKYPLFSRYKLDYYEEKPYIDFFFWIACSICDDNLRNLTGKNERLLEKAQENCIELFFSCSEIKQLQMLQAYNIYLKQESEFFNS